MSEQASTTASDDESRIDTHRCPGHWARLDPTRSAVITDSGRTVTYAELEDRSCQLAQALRHAGVGRGEHVAVLLENSDRTLEVAWGLQRAGVYYTFVNTHLSPDEAAYIVNDCGARVLLTSSHMGELAESLLEKTPAISARWALGAPVRGHEGYDDVVGSHPATPLERETEGAPMLYSSGTTGRPKGVRRPLGDAPFGSAEMLWGVLGGLMGFTAGDRYLNPAPLYHAAPLVWSMTAHRLGGTVVVMERFNPAQALAHIAQHRITHGQFVPTMFVRMLKLPEDVRRSADLSSLRAVVHAAAPCPREVKRQMIEWWGPIIYEYYAGTEGGGMTWITSKQWLAHPGSVGPALTGRIHICDDKGNELPAGHAGTIWLGEGGSNFEYHNDPEKTSQSYNERGWNTLWDVGHVDTEGYLFLTDRKLYMIVSGGVNIYPQEIEDVMVLHPKVADVAVFGIPDPEMGEAVKAVVQPSEGAFAEPALEAELLAWTRERLAHYKCPRSIDFLEALPRGDNGKLYKRILRDRYWAGHASSIV